VVVVRSITMGPWRERVHRNLSPKSTKRVSHFDSSGRQAHQYCGWIAREALPDSQERAWLWLTHTIVKANRWLTLKNLSVRRPTRCDVRHNCHSRQFRAHQHKIRMPPGRVRPVCETVFCLAFLFESRTHAGFIWIGSISSIP
jgi:hypothetical protein